MAHCDPVLKMLERMGATEEQMSFFQAWAEIVGNKALALPDSTNTVSVTTDIHLLEFRITASPADAMLNLGRDFVQQCGVSGVQLEEMDMAQAELKADKVTLWAKLKHMGPSSTGHAPAIDAGYELNKSMDWVVADMLMPSVDDQDALRDYAVQENVRPGNFGCSFFPTDPEKRLTFEMGTGDLYSNTKKSLLSAFFFFKSLGFAKPDDNVVRLLSSSQPQKFVISVSMGPRGLTRLAVTLSQPAKMIARGLAEAVSFKFDEAGVDALLEIVGAPIDSVDYAADAEGYLVAVSFSQA